MTSEKIDLICKRLQIAQSRQKSCFENSRRKVEFEVRDIVFLKVALMKGVMRFGKNGKLSPRFVGLFEILKRIRKVAYELALSPTLAGVHNVFHFSMLRKYIPDPSHVLNYEPHKIKDNLTYEEILIQILDRKDHVLRTKTISLVKVLWKNHTVDEASWEQEDEMKSKYLELFVNEGVGSKNSATSAHFILSLRPMPRRKKRSRTNKESPSCQETSPRTILSSAN